VVKGALAAYGGNLERTSMHEQLKSAGSTSQTTGSGGGGGAHSVQSKTAEVNRRNQRGPQDMRILLTTSKAGMHFGNDGEGKLYVTRVLKGGAAYDMGVQVNDKIMAVNGVVSVRREGGGACVLLGVSCLSFVVCLC
jgi:C-terminal processing protease CtpA/Prc